MTPYKSALTEANTILGISSPMVRFIGYGLMKGRAMGTLQNVEHHQIIEMPVAENLMAGFATGMSLAGYLPVIFIERMDFVLNALDSLVNHTDKIGVMSNNQFNPAIIIRAVVGNKRKPLYTGLTHTQDFSEALERMFINITVVRLCDAGDILPAYSNAMQRQRQGHSSVLVEYKDFV